MRKVVFASIFACIFCGIFTGCELKRADEQPKEEAAVVANEDGEAVAAASSVAPEESPVKPAEEESPADEAK